MNNERGGILSKLFIIPVGVALMVGFFFLGYYVGNYQAKSKTKSELMPPLPDVVSQDLPKKDDFTFYKTLTDKNDKTVSINLKPEQASEEKTTEKKQTVVEEPKKKVEKKAVAVEAPKHKTPAPAPKVKQLEIKIEKEPAVAAKPKQTAAKQPTPLAKKEPAPTTSSNAKVRYTLQVASYPNKDGAEQDVKRLKQNGYAAFIVAADVPGKGVWYRVRLGSFSNKASAEKLQKDVQAKQGISSIVVME
jgi:cell division protein FtsN